MLNTFNSIVITFVSLSQVVMQKDILQKDFDLPGLNLKIFGYNQDNLNFC